MTWLVVTPKRGYEGRRHFPKRCRRWCWIFGWRDRERSKSRPLDGASEVRVDQTCLHGGTLVFEVDFQDAVHAREGDHDAAGAGKCAAGKARACATADDGSVALSSEFDDTGDLFRSGGKNDRVGPAFFHPKRHIRKGAGPRAGGGQHLGQQAFEVRERERSFQSEPRSSVLRCMLPLIEIVEMGRNTSCRC